MRKNSTFKSLLLLCLLWVGMGSVSAQEQGQYAWHKVTNLSDVKSDDLVLVVGEPLMQFSVMNVYNKGGEQEDFVEDFDDLLSNHSNNLWDEDDE